MKAGLLVTLAALASGCGPSGDAPSIARASTFLATVTRVEPCDARDPYRRWIVTLKVDEIISGPSPGAGFWFAIHSPSQDGVKVGQRYRITAENTDGGYEIASRERQD